MNSMNGDVFMLTSETAVLFSLENSINTGKNQQKAKGKIKFSHAK